MTAILARANGEMKSIVYPDEHEFDWYAKQIGCEWIEVVHPEKLPSGFAMVVDEEGLLNEKPINHFASWLYGFEKHAQPIVGDVLIVKEVFTDEGLDLAGMTKEEGENLIDCLVRVADRAIRCKRP